MNEFTCPVCGSHFLYRYETDKVKTTSRAVWDDTNNRFVLHEYLIDDEDNLDAWWECRLGHKISDDELRKQFGDHWEIIHE